MRLTTEFSIVKMRIYYSGFRTVNSNLGLELDGFNSNSSPIRLSTFGNRYGMEAIRWKLQERIAIGKWGFWAYNNINNLIHKNGKLE